VHLRRYPSRRIRRIRYLFLAAGVFAFLSSLFVKETFKR
jgi:hypothetical protein